MATKLHGTSDIYGFFGDLVRCETRLYNLFNDELRERYGLTTAQFEFLRYVRDHANARVADIATEFAAGVGAISKGTDRLERQGLVARRPNPDDRRSAILQLTVTGRRLVDDADGYVQTRLRELTAASISPEQLAATSETLASLRAVLEERSLGTPTG